MAEASALATGLAAPRSTPCFCTVAQHPQSPDRELEAAELPLGDHQPELFDARVLQRRRVRYRTTAPGGQEVGQREADPGPPARRGLEAGLVIDAVEAAVGAQGELVAVAIAAHFELDGAVPARIEPCAVESAACLPHHRAAHRGEAAVVVRRHRPGKQRMAGGIEAQGAARHAAHDAVVDRRPGDDRLGTVEAEEGGMHG